MKEFLHNIKSIPEVIGIIAIDVLLPRVDSLFAKEYAESNLNEITAQLEGLSKAIPTKALLTIYFAEKVAVTYIDSNFRILILAKTAVEMNSLKKKLMELLNALYARQVSVQTKSEQDAPAGIESIEEKYLVKAINDLSQKVRQAFSGYIASRELKSKRDQLLDSYKFLNGLYIDNSGNCAIISSPLTYDDAESTAAFQRLFDDFRTACIRINSKIKLPTMDELVRSYRERQLSETK